MRNLLFHVRPTQKRCAQIFTSLELGSLYGFNLRQQSPQVFSKFFQRQARKIRRRDFEFDERIFEMLHRAMRNTATQLMMRSRGLNQPLNKKTPRLGVALPNAFPCFMGLPIFARVEQLEAFAQIVAVFLTQPRREPGGVQRRGAQLVLLRGRVR